MKLSTLLTSLTLGCAIAGATALSTSAVAAENRSGPVSERPWLSIPQIHDKLVAAGFRDVEKIERERGGYEVRATDRHGERTKLYLNPQTGEITGERNKGTQADGREGRRQNSADCNQRRCRDDLPPKPITPTPAGK